ncbi:DUF4194 domain-containing protein [Sphingobium yanoikuyae]|uniref:DUF4194 domain-containing protein n=1 Tax=Sphingobium yanoikuyae TaxID=13690 RepID=UPI002FDA66C7
MAELREVANLLDGAKVTEEELQTALQALLFHQCLYEDWPYPPAYRLIVRHFATVQSIVRAFGYRLVNHAVAGMVVLEADGVVYGVHMARLKKDETIALLILRLLYAEGISSLDERGRVHSNTDDIYDRLRTAGEEPPAMARLMEILKGFQRKGLVRLGEHDPEEKILQLQIMPGITVLVPDVYVEAVILWLEQRAFGEEADAQQPATDSMFAHLADYRANLGAEPVESSDMADEADAQDDPNA